MQTPSRREFLRLASTAAAALPLGCGGGPDPGSEPRSAPNIVLIMADDMGISDIGPYGGEIPTPTLDRLAANGLRLRQFYNGARCCPTRASLVTGLYAHQAGVGHMMEEIRKDGKVLPAYAGRLNDRSVTIAEALKPAGYTTLMSGKWHVTPAVDRRVETPTDKSNWPRQRGFDRFFGTIHGAGSYYDPVSLTMDNEPIAPESTDFYYTTEIGKHAVEFIEQAPRERPFFLYMPFTSPHWPLQAPAEDIAANQGKYDIGWDELRRRRRESMTALGLIKPEWNLTARDSGVPAWDDAPNKEWEARRMEVYAAQITVMDRAIGRLVSKLEELDELDNTLILFLADNGGCAENLGPKSNGLHFPDKTLDGRPVTRGNDPAEMPGQPDDYQSYGPPWANASNTPFRLYKHWVHEGGISSPLIAHWPDRMTVGGQWSDEPSHLIDIMATCVDVAGAEYPGERNGVAITPLEGRSLAPLFEGHERDGHDAIFWEHEGNRAVRQGKWKLASKWSQPEDGRWELYDLEADRTETNDLALEMPDKVLELADLWQTWADRVGVVEWRSWDENA